MAPSTASNNFTEVSYPEPHIGRTKQILKAHPEVRQLFGNTPSSAIYLVAIVTFQIVIAVALRHSPWWVVIGAAYLLGAFANHALFVMIHEATHNLITKSSVSNRVWGMIANIPLVSPCAMGFRSFHLLHHRYQGEDRMDADLAGPKEAAWVGNSPARKALWMLGFVIIEGFIRPARLKHVNVFDVWGFTNLGFQILTMGTLLYFCGWASLVYLGLSLVFSIGLHPVGARWIQEHYLIPEAANRQETYSYYGILNKICFNVGYHNEHHDLMMVPWSNLPKLKAMAPEFYEPLYAHYSWTKLLLRFLFAGDINLFSRAVRNRDETKRSESEASQSAASSLLSLDPGQLALGTSDQSLG